MNSIEISISSTIYVLKVGKLIYEYRLGISQSQLWVKN